MAMKTWFVGGKAMRYRLRSKAAVLAAAVTLIGCAATTQNYKVPEISGKTPGLLVTRANAHVGKGCLNAVLVDGKSIGTIGVGEVLHVPLPAGQYYVRWDGLADKICPERPDLAHRLVTVRPDGPLMLRLEIQGEGKMLIPLYGMFVSPEYKIVIEGEES